MSNKRIAIYAMLVAITIVLAITPIGMIQLPIISITIMHIPVIIAAILYGVQGGTILGVVFGIAAWYTALTRAVTPVDLLFQNPLFAVLPRILFGVFTGLLAQFVMKKDLKLEVKAGIIGLSGSLIHSILVLGFLFLFALLDFTGMTILEALQQYFVALIGALTANVIIEAVAAMAISIAITHALQRVHVLKK